MACGSDEHKPVDVGLNYFPLQKGFYQIYKVNSIIYKLSSDPDTLNFERMVEVVDSLPNAGGGYIYVIHRSTRADENAAWTYEDTWSAYLSNNEAVVREQNISFVKLLFPIKEGNSWDGNKYNNEGEDEYLIENTDVPVALGGTAFDKTLTVTQETNDDPIVFTDMRKEIYARNAGLIYKEIMQLHYCTVPNCLGKKLIERGEITKQEIKSYGVH
jgi:hypothetical protein